MVWFRLTAGLQVGCAGLVSARLLTGSARPDRTLSFLAGHGGGVYVPALVWLWVAPVVLLVAALLVRRTPWPWVLAVTLQLSVLVVLAARVAHWVSTPGWFALAVLVGLGAVSAGCAVGCALRTAPSTRKHRPTPMDGSSPALDDPEHPAGGERR